MSKPLRSNFTPGTPRWAVRRAQWKSLGLTDADLEKPKIAVINTSSELSSCFSHLDGVSARVKAAIRAAGGLAFEVRTAAPSDFITSAGRQGRYILPSRDLLVNDIEVQVEGAMLDGMVCLASCDKTAPGQLMAAARLDIPSLVVACGYQPHGHLDGRAVRTDQRQGTLDHQAHGAAQIQPEPGEPYAGACRGRREVEAESVAFVVAAAHHLDTSQYTFNYVAGWASQAATPEHGIEAVVAETGARVIATADAILAHTKPADLETKLVDAVAEDLGVTAGLAPKVAGLTPEPEVWETLTFTPSPGAQAEARRPIPLERGVEHPGIGI